MITAAAFAPGMGESFILSLYYAMADAVLPVLKPFVDIQPHVYSSLCTDSLLGFANEPAALSIDGARQ